MIRYGVFALQAKRETRAVIFTGSAQKTYFGCLFFETQAYLQAALVKALVRCGALGRSVAFGALLHLLRLQ